MAQKFVVPEFINGNTAAEIQARMMSHLPDDIDGMPGGFAWDFTMPTALEKSELIQYHLMRTLMLMFPEWAWDEWLDLHGRQIGIQRKAANYASGYITITGESGKTLPAGFIVCTPATDNTPSVLFSLDEDTVIPEEGTITAPITAVEPGPNSNVAAGKVIIMSSPVEGIISITNEEELTGGSRAEKDDDYRARIDDANANSDTSYIGNDTDYIRWAVEVEGIGACIVSQAWNGPGTVKLSLVDENGYPANDQLCEAVYKHIVSPNNRAERLLPTGTAELTVVPAETVTLSYSCRNLKYDSSITNHTKIVDDFTSALASYYVQAKKDGVVKWNVAHSLLTAVDGVTDFNAFKINERFDNVELGTTIYPKTGDILLNE